MEADAGVLRASIAVVVPTLDEESEIEETLRAIGSRCEVLVVDGGSRDETVRRASAMGARVLRSSPGRARQMNYGASNTDADILVFVHADTHLPLGWDATIVQALGEGAIGGRFDLTLRGSHRFLPVIAGLINFRSRMSRIYTGDQAIFVKRAVFERIGGYEAIELMEDIALSLRLKRAGRIACLRQKVSTSARRWESRGVIRTIALMWWLRFAYFAGVSPATLRRMYR